MVYKAYCFTVRFCCKLLLLYFLIRFIKPQFLCLLTSYVMLGNWSIYVLCITLFSTTVCFTLNDAI